jgi:hypothetical protein
LEVANHIVSLGIDPDLDRGSDELVGRIAKVVVSGKADRYNYSFATKYSSWHKPESYPIFDSRVGEYLWHLRKHGCLSRFHRDTLWDYPTFKRIVTEFRDKFGLGDFTFKHLDEFLYSQGGILLNQKGTMVLATDGADVGQSMPEMLAGLELVKSAPEPDEER